MIESERFRPKFVKQPSLLRQAVVNRATAEFNKRNHLAELNAAIATARFKEDPFALEAYYDEMFRRMAKVRT